MDSSRKSWTKREIARLGTVSDRALAQRLGRTRKAVEAQRRQLGIAPHVPHARVWTKRELALLGTMPDAVLAARLGCSRKHVLETRQRLGVKTATPRNTPRKFRRRH